MMTKNLTWDENIFVLVEILDYSKRPTWDFWSGLQMCGDQTRGEGAGGVQNHLDPQS